MDKMEQRDRSLARPNMSIARPNLRPKFNGPRTVEAGRVVATGINAYDTAVVMRKNLEIDFEGLFSYEITGVAGNYKIVERDKESSHSQYVA